MGDVEFDLINCCVLVSISYTFCACILRPYFGAKNYKAEMYLEEAAQSSFVQKIRA